MGSHTHPPNAEAHQTEARRRLREMVRADAGEGGGIQVREGRRGRLGRGREELQREGAGG